MEMGKSPWGMCVDTRFGRVVDAERVNGILSRLVSDGARSVLVGTTDGTDVTKVARRAFRASGPPHGASQTLPCPWMPLRGCPQRVPVLWGTAQLV